MEPWPLLGGQNSGDSIFAAGQNPFGLAKVDRAPIRQLVIDLLQDWPDLLVLIVRQIHLASPPLRRATKPAKWIALAPHLILRRAHN